MKNCHHLMLILLTLAKYVICLKETVKNISNVDGKKNYVDTILAPVLITLFIVLISLVVVIFYIGIRKHLKRIKAEEEKQDDLKKMFPTTIIEIV